MKLFIQIYMHKIFRVLILLALTLPTFAQQGGRIGIISGVANTSMVNADDTKADDRVFKLLPTFGFSSGIELSYNWRYFGVGAQLMKSQAGQRYNYYGQTQETRLNYIKPTFLIHFNSNPKNPVRFSGYFGAAYGILNSYKEISQITNPVTRAITYSTIQNKEYTMQDTGFIAGTLSDGIYYKSDASVVAALGADFKWSNSWLFGIHARLDMGMEKLENYDKLKQKYTVGATTYTYDYEHWKYRPSKFDYQPTYNGVRATSTNMSMGIYVSIKYILMSKEVREYERYGY